jgi:ATP-dependent 26S proteasome regulatory subunit
MSEEQITKILKHLERQDRAIADLSNLGNELKTEIKEINERINPVVELLHDASGFKKVSVAFIKGVLLFGSGVGVIYAFVNWIRN